MRENIFVIAGDYNEFLRLTKPVDNPKYHFHYVHKPDMLRGCKGIRFMISQGGFKRKDLREMYENLVLANIGTEEEASVRSLKMELLLYA